MKPPLLRYLFFLVICFSYSCKKSVQNGVPEISGIYPVAVGSGDVVTIYGKGFTSTISDNNVSIGGVSAEVVSASRNKIVIIVPATASSGVVSVASSGRLAVVAGRLEVVTVINGGPRKINLITLAKGKKYLVRGNVFADKIIIPEGVIVFFEKETNASLRVYNTDIEGTAQNPVVFTSNQPPGQRSAGDWQGLTILGFANGTSNQNPFGVIRYLRVEYAGSHSSTTRGAGILFNNVSFQNTIDHVQVSYSDGDAFSMNMVSRQLPTSTSENSDEVSLARYLVAFACAGADFRMTGIDIYVQFALGIKDPYKADRFSTSEGISVTGNNIRMTNVTLVGGNPVARNINLGINSFAVNNDVGASLQIGGYKFGANGTATNSQPSFYLFNSIIAGSYLAGVVLQGAKNSSLIAPFDIYENKKEDIGTADQINQIYLVTLRDNVFYGTASPNLSSSPSNYARGGFFVRKNYLTAQSGLEDITSTSQYLAFCSYNDTAKRLSFLDPNVDELGIAGLLDYNRLNSPEMLPRLASPLLTGASFGTGTGADVNQFNKEVRYRGAFGTEDWTKNWCNFDPQQKAY